ncbi:unnamed protein product [Ascophyllum nodosum]
MAPQNLGTCRTFSNLFLALLVLPLGGAFLGPARVDIATRQVSVRRVPGHQRLAVGRAPSTVRMALAEGIEKDNDQEPHNIAPVGHDAANARTAGPLQRVRSFLSRNVAAVAAMSALLTAGRAGPAEAFWGRGKPVDAPALPTFEEQVENISEELSEAATEVLGDSDTDKEVAVLGFDKQGGASTGSLDGNVAAEAEDGDQPKGLKNSLSALLGSLRRAMTENAVVTIVGVGGTTFAVSRRRGGTGGGSRGRKSYGRNSAASRSQAAAPKSPSAGIGKPRVSPEVAEADSKKKEESLKNATFDMDEDLFDDAVSDSPARPSPPTSSEAPQEATKAERDPEPIARVAVETETTPASLRAEDAAESPLVETFPEPASVPTSPTTQEKPKRRGPMMNLFKRDVGPQRATTLVEALSAESPDVAEFRQATAAVLARSAPVGMFEVKEPSVLEEATITPVDGEGEAAEKAAYISRIQALQQLLQTAGLSSAEAAESVANIVNAMVVRLVDEAVNGKDDRATSDASDALLAYMDGAGALFASLCPGAELDPPIRYKGSSKRGKLEGVFETAARKALKTGDEGQMSKLDRLQDLLCIKEAKASMMKMDLMMKMMSEGGTEDTEGLEKMMASMGAGGMEGMPGMGGAAKSPEEMKQEIEALKAMVESGDCPREEVDALRKMYKDAGMDIDQVVNDPMMEASMDSGAKEVVQLLRKLLALHPK